MPQAALAAVVVASIVELIKPAEFRAIRRVRRTEFRWALVAFAGVILLGTLQGILVAVIVSLLGARPAGATTRRCTSSAASAAPTCSARSRPSIPTTRPGRAC